MRKLFISIIILTFGLIITGCGNDSPSSDSGNTEDTFIKYEETISLTKSYEGKSFLTDGIGEVELYRNVDGDTAHFTEVGKTYSFSVRFLGVNTPESTGKIEEWGKAASNYTADKLNNATTIVLESSTDGPPTMTNDRYLGWVWVDGVLLNLELVVYGYSRSSVVEGSSYNDTLISADFQAQKNKLIIWSDDLDPDYYYGEAEYATLKEIRTNISDYYAKKVRFTGIVTRKDSTNAYLQYHDEDTDTYYGMYVYTMFSQPISNVLAVGNEVEITGIISYYDYNGGTPEQNQGSYQLVDVQYSQFFPTEDNLNIISTNNLVVGYEVFAEDINATTNPLIENTFVTINGLSTTGGYTGTNGEMSIYCQDSNGNTVDLRLSADVITDSEGNVIKTHTQFIEAVGNGTISISGIVTKFNGQFQIQIAASIDITYN